MRCDGAARVWECVAGLTDSGLGRATPPRRAMSPGVRALGSPAGGAAGPASGPGSLPGAIGKRRHHAPDDSSDVSSTHSSIMDYSGEYQTRTPYYTHYCYNDDFLYNPMTVIDNILLWCCIWTRITWLIDFII